MKSRGSIREHPAYTIHEAARYVRLPAPTLRSWFAGSRGLTPAGRQPVTLSFSNLIEAHVLRSLRTEHGVPLDAVRQGLRFAERELEIDRLLLREELRTAGGELFLKRYGELANLSLSRQLATRRIFEAHLERIEWKVRWAARLYPFVVANSVTDKPIVIDPEISFGRPVVEGAFISTGNIRGRTDAGESVDDVARDYELTRDAVEQAVVFERAA